MCHGLSRLVLAIGVGAMTLTTPAAYACSDLRSPLILFVDDAPHHEAQVPIFGGLAGALVVGWTNRMLNRELGEHVAALRAALPDLDKSALAAEALQCVAVADPTKGCRPVQTAIRMDAEVDAILDGQPDHCAFVAVVSLRLLPATFLARVDLREIERVDGETRVTKTYQTAYATSPPEDLVDQAGKKAEAIDRYWREGSPSRLAREVAASLTDLRQLLDETIARSAADGEKMSEWPLPDVKTREAPGRYRCRGMGGATCKGVKLLRETADRSWLVGLTLQGTQGAVSLDRNASAYSTNVSWVTDIPMTR